MTTTNHTKEISCDCGCGRTSRVALNVIRWTDGICVMRGHRPARLITPDLFAETAQPEEPAHAN